MLVLTRHKQESIVIGEGAAAITVMVVDIRGAAVRLGIEAAKSLPVHRKEVHDAILRKGESLNSKPSNRE